MDREPIVAGQFYPENKRKLQLQVAEYLDGTPGPQKTMLAMCPHAGYVFSGPVAGKTLSRANLAENIILIGPNHTGSGADMAVWTDGRWNIPGGSVNINKNLAQELCSTRHFEADYSAHMREHSLEVILPFLKAINDKINIVPISIYNPIPDRLFQAGRDLAHLIKNNEQDISIVVSSDMSHYIPQNQAEKQDNLALEQILSLSPQGLLDTVAQNRISMCGVLPMVLALECVTGLGASKAELIAYSTSGDVLGDRSQVVGYAGVLIS
ncbi:MAG: AmmeMemoRadiSam system protein B [Thermodesulfobacteriota bacterium]